MIAGTYKVLGTNEDETFCSVCGRQELSKVVWLESDTCEIFHCGVNCASKLTKWSTAKINGQINNTIQDNKGNINYWNTHPMVIAERADMLKDEFETFKEGMSELSGAEAGGKYHGFEEGVKYVLDIINKGKS